ncbi:hypothetical protein CKO22_17900 [Thiococcus pfennigii]|nr:hypothetical protein [Thiococcus pfennigii]
MHAPRREDRLANWSAADLTLIIGLNEPSTCKADGHPVHARPARRAPGGLALPTKKQEERGRRATTIQSAQAAAARYRALLDHAPFALLVVDRHGIIIESSPVADRLLAPCAAPDRGRTIDSRDWVIVDRAGRRMAPAAYPAVRALRERILVQEEIIGCVGEQGRTAWLSVTAVPLPRGHQGDASGVLVTLRDVTRQLDLESMPDQLASAREAERRFRQMAEGLPVIVWIAKPNGTREFFNRHYADFLGLDPAEVTGQEHEWRPFIHPDDVRPYLALFKTSLRRRRPFEAEFRGLRHDGEWRWVKSHGRPWWAPDGEYMGLVGATFDITDRKQAELALQESHAHLREHADALARLASQLVLTEQRERERFGQILHDRMQQDLLAVKFKLHAILRDSAEDHRQPLSDAIALVDRSINTSRTLHADLSPAFLREGSFHVTLAWLAESFERDHGLRVATDLAHDAIIEREEPRVVVFESVREALLNIVKHARVDQAEIQMHRGADGRIGVCVSDQGVGFARAPDHAPGPSGNGLRMIEERLGLVGGALRVESRPGAGTRVHMSLPPQTD